jgi:hypothetical protein
MNLKPVLTAKNFTDCEKALKGVILQGKNATILLAVLEGKTKHSFIVHGQYDKAMYAKVLNLFDNPTSLAKSGVNDGLHWLNQAYRDLASKGKLSDATDKGVRNAAKTAQILRDSVIYKYVVNDDPLPEYYSNLIASAVKKMADDKANERSALIAKATKAIGELSLNEKIELLASLQFTVEGEKIAMLGNAPKLDISPIVDLFMSELGLDQAFAEQMEKTGFTTLEEVAYVQPEGWQGLNKRKAKVAQTRAHKLVLERMAEQVA